jgi:O-antigen/teichoic acid export membrane protein
MKIGKPVNLGLRKLSGNIGYTMLRQVWALILGLGLVLLVARVLGPEGNGQYAVALLLPTLLASLLNLGIAPANVYFVGKGEVTVDTALATGLRLWLAMGGIGMIGGASVIFWRAHAWFPGVPATALWIVLAVFPLILLQSFLQSLLQGVQDFRRYNLVMLASPAVTLALTLATIWHWRIQGALFACVAGHAIGLLVGIHNIRPHLSQTPHFLTRSTPEVRAYAAACIGYGWKAHLSNILTLVNYRADIFLVNLFLTPAVTGVYVIAVQIAERLWLLSRAVSTVLLPRLSQLHIDEVKRHRLTPLVARWVLLVTLPAALAMGLLSRPFIRSLFGVEYFAAADALIILLPGVVAGSVARILASDIAARGRPILNMYTAIAVVVTNVLGNVILIPSMGLRGAALATTLAYLLNAFIKLYLYTRLSGNHWSASVLPNRRDLQMVIDVASGFVKKRTLGPL